jgi:hypothetical protein
VVYDNFREIRKDVVPYEVCTQPHKDYSKKPTQYSLEETYDLCLQNLKPKKYIDTHCFVLTPYSFFEILKSLIEHDLFNYEVASFKNTPFNQLEFYVSFRLSKKSTKAQKLKSIPRIAKPKETRDLELQILKLKNEKQTLIDEIHKLTTSKSWQITKPLRKIISTSQKIRHK